MMTGAPEIAFVKRRGNGSAQIKQGSPRTRAIAQTTPRALVAGGAGFIGRNLCRSLLARGYVVYCVDNLTTGQDPADEDLGDSFHFFHGDVASDDVFERLLKVRYDEVYNLACPTGVPNIALLGEEMLVTSSVGSINLLKIAKRWEAKYLFASTAEVYGEAEVVPQPESYTGNVDPIGERSPYEEGKRFGEAIAALYARKYGVDVRIIRVFNTYGPSMAPSDQRVIPRLVSATINGTAFTIFGDGTQTRSFLFVDDLIEGFFVALAKGRSGDVFNVGSSDELTILQLGDEAVAAFGLNILVEFRPQFIRDHRRRCPDTSRIASLGWSPKVGLRDGLRRSLNDMVRRSEGRASAA